MSDTNHQAPDDQSPEDQATGDAAATPSPDVRVVKGNPSDGELAALVAVLKAAQAASAVAGDSRPPELWGSPQSLHRRFAPYSAYSYAASGRHTR
ncbi:acyl-CoA carboxylase epsilon subunit [Rhodococcus sp. KRD162]|uniref:acyl-CoA carboxylase epsilon subunit n=1 Tax=unclassified Rhodococcus (in: high G+C Gram-positive bacteria) TaxID=192944 RepID=UPI0019D102E7|nr:acyl-CoA carboxylase epsilon subunit [Rhodococcus sp. KRD162]